MTNKAKTRTPMTPKNSSWLILITAPKPSLWPNYHKNSSTKRSSSTWVTLSTPSYLRSPNNSAGSSKTNRVLATGMYGGLIGKLSPTLCTGWICIRRLIIFQGYMCWLGRIFWGCIWWRCKRSSRQSIISFPRRGCYRCSFISSDSIFKVWRRGKLGRILSSRKLCLKAGGFSWPGVSRMYWMATNTSSNVT